MKIHQGTVAYIVALNLIGSQLQSAMGRPDSSHGNKLRSNRELSTLHSQDNQKLALFSGAETAGITNHAEADSFCRNKERVIASKKEWCSFAIQHPLDEYGPVPVRSGAEYMDVEEICGNICEDDDADQLISRNVQNPILCTKIVTKAPELPNTCASVYDDPHIKTFDGLEYDCHGPGDFVLSKSLSPNGHELQGRFFKLEGAGWQGSVTTGAVMKTGHPNEPTVEVLVVDNQAPRFEGKLEYFIDGTKINLDSNWSGEGTLAAGSDKVQFFLSGDNRYFFFPESGISFHITKRYQHTFGQFMNVRLCLPDDIKSEKVVGVLGSPNGDQSDDFMDRTGTNQNGVNTWYWGQINDFCKETWCVAEEELSLFVEPGSNSFCTAPATHEEAPTADDPEVQQICGDSLGCILEGNSGGIEAAHNFLKDKEDQDKDEQIPPEGEDDDEDDFDLEDLKDICTKSTDPPTASPTPESKCNIAVQPGRTKWYAAIKVGFNEPAMDIDFTDTGLSLSTVTVSADAFDVTRSGETLKLTRKSWIQPNFNSPSQVRFAPKNTSGGNPAMATFELPYCGKKPTSQPITDAPTHKPTPPPSDSPTRKPTGAPTEPPSGAPTHKPTDAPSLKPTDAVTESPTVAPTPAPKTPAPTETPTSPPINDRTGPTTPPKKGSGSGDPHFKTWTGDKYDYHGECDLVLVDNPSFADGLGLRLHIRTTRVKYFSFIEKVALQIGKEVLEFDNDVEKFLINGTQVDDNRKHHKTLLSGFLVRRDPSAISVRLHKQGKAKIDFHTRKNGFPAVIVDAGHTDLFKGSLGLLGEYGTGIKLARDGKTEIKMDGADATAFALEWQVRDTEPMLFKDARAPQFPTTCTPPAQQRLGDSLFKAEAEEACAHWETDQEDCIFDVMATRDILVAEEGHIVHIE